MLEPTNETKKNYPDAVILGKSDANWITTHMFCSEEAGITRTTRVMNCGAHATQMVSTTHRDKNGVVTACSDAITTIPFTQFVPVMDKNGIITDYYWENAENPIEKMIEHRLSAVAVQLGELTKVLSEVLEDEEDEGDDTTNEEITENNEVIVEMSEDSSGEGSETVEVSETSIEGETTIETNTSVENTSEKSEDDLKHSVEETENFSSAVEMIISLKKTNSLPKVAVFASANRQLGLELAKVTAKWLFKTDGLEMSKCENCQKIDADEFPSYIEVRSENEKPGEDQIAKLFEKVDRPPDPLHGQWVVMIDEFQKMENLAQGVIMKKLEDVNSSRRFIFTTTEIDRIPKELKDRGLMINIDNNRKANAG